MAKDLFESDYFSKHRDNSSTESRDGSKMHKYLNLKHKPRFEEPIAIPEDATEDIFDDDEETSTNSMYQNEFMRLVFAGFAGGLIVLIHSLVNYVGISIWSWLFWKSLVVVVLIGIILFLLLGLFAKAFNK